MLISNGNGTFSIARPDGYGESPDERRYRWLRKELAEGRETYIGEWVTSPETLDKYIDAQIKKASEK